MRATSESVFCSLCLSLLLIGAVGCKDEESHEVARLRLRLDSLAVTLTAVTTAMQNGALDRPRAPDTATVSIRPVASLGSESAPITIVEFTDYQCPFCARHSRSTLTAIRRDYVDRGLVRYQLRDLPLSDIHAFARSASIAARCVAALHPDRFWRYHDRLFASQRQLSNSTFSLIATELGLDIAGFDMCTKSEQFESQIDLDIQEARAAGLASTPAFVIGPTISNDSIRGSVLLGALPYASFQAAIDAALGRHKPR